MTLTAAMITLFLCTVPAAKAATAKRALRIEVQRVEHAKTTLRFFDHHPRLLYRSAWHIRAAAWREVTNARARVVRGRARIRRLRSLLQPIPHLREWLCIHAGEGSWTDPGGPYYGGLQMDVEFQTTYGYDFYRAKGTADHWTPREQMLVAERAYRTRGFYPWPETARNCGLI